MNTVEALAVWVCSLRCVGHNNNVIVGRVPHCSVHGLGDTQQWVVEGCMNCGGPAYYRTHDDSRVDGVHDVWGPCSRVVVNEVIVCRMRLDMWWHSEP